MRTSSACTAFSLSVPSVINIRSALSFCSSKCDNTYNDSFYMRYPMSFMLVMACCDRGHGYLPNVCSICCCEWSGLALWFSANSTNNSRNSVNFIAASSWKFLFARFSYISRAFCYCCSLPRFASLTCCSTFYLKSFSGSTSSMMRPVASLI